MLKNFMPQPLFAPETLTGARAQKKVMPAGHGYGSALYVCHGSYNIAANVEANDIFELCWTPANFLCLGGQWVTADLDTGTEALVMDLGWAANGGGSETYKADDGTVYTNAASTASAAGLVDSAVLTGDAVTDLIAAGVNYRPILLARPLLFTRPTLIQVTANVAAATFAAGWTTATLYGRII